MKVLVCEICGNQGLNKNGDRFVCPSCGTGYPVEEAKKLMQEVDAPAETPQATEAAEAAQPAQAPVQALEKYLTLARQAADGGNYKEAAKYFALAKEQDANDWEAVFYSNFYTAADCTIGQIPSSCAMVVRTGTLTLEMLKSLNAGHRFTAVRMILDNVRSLCDMMRDSTNDYDKKSAAVTMYEKLVIAVLTTFPEERNVLFACAEHCGALLNFPYTVYTKATHEELMLKVFATFCKEEARVKVTTKINNLKCINEQLQATHTETDNALLAKFAIPGVLFDIISLVLFYIQYQEGFDNLVVLICSTFVLLIGLLFTFLACKLLPKAYTPEELARNQRKIEENNKEIEKLEKLLQD